jgi:hypothetical protein
MGSGSVSDFDRLLVKTDFLPYLIELYLTGNFNSFLFLLFGPSRTNIIIACGKIRVRGQKLPKGKTGK